MFQPDPSLAPLLDKFENAFRNELEHSAFNKLGAVKVRRKDARRWGSLWSMNNPSKIERKTMFRRLGGKEANNIRREGIALLVAAYSDLKKETIDPSPEELRTRMADLPEAWKSKSGRPAISSEWRTLQVRQLFRLALESLFFWIIGVLLSKGPMRSAQIARAFLDTMKPTKYLPKTARDWIQSMSSGVNPVDLLRQIKDELHRKPRDDKNLTNVIFCALVFCLNEAPSQSRDFEGDDRLPLCRAKRDAEAWKDSSPAEFLTRVIEVWILAQHSYWSVGRGLADARSRGKRILRLKVVMDEDGWTLTPGTTKQGNPPKPTPDRLETALNLLRECDKLK